MCICDPVAKCSFGRELEPRVDREQQPVRARPRRYRAQRSDDVAPRVYRNACDRKAAVEDALVLCLDTGAADDLPRLCSRVASFLKLPPIDLTEQAEELAAERPSRIPALRQHADTEPTELGRALIEVACEPTTRAPNHDGGRERRTSHAAPDVGDQRPRRHVRNPREVP